LQVTQEPNSSLALNAAPRKLSEQLQRNKEKIFISAKSKHRIGMHGFLFNLVVFAVMGYDYRQKAVL